MARFQIKLEGSLFFGSTGHTDAKVAGLVSPHGHGFCVVVPVFLGGCGAAIFPNVDEVADGAAHGLIQFKFNSIQSNEIYFFELRRVQKK